MASWWSAGPPPLTNAPTHPPGPVPPVCPVASGAAVLGLARLYTDTVDTRAKARLYVNVQSPVIERLLEAPEPKQRAAAAVLRGLARLMASHSDEESAQQLGDTLDSFMEGMAKLLED